MSPSVTTVFQVTNMHCPACVMQLEALEDAMVGIERITASYRKQQMEVVYDAAVITPAQIIAQAKERGYDVHAR